MLGAGIRLGFIQPDVTETVFLYIVIANSVPKPSARVRIGRIKVRPGLISGPPKIGAAVRFLDKPAFRLEQLVIS